MPWKPFERGGRWCVYKIDADGKPTGATLGCHDTRAEADAQVAALYANEPAKAGVRPMEYKGIRFLGKEIGEDRIVKSLFAVMGNVDVGGDRIWLGAFAKTIRERTDRLKILWQHDYDSPPIGVPMQVTEIDRSTLPEGVTAEYPDATGALQVAVRYLDTPRGNEVLDGIRQGAITENSIGYDPVKFDFEENVNAKGAMIRNLREIRLWDLSPVLWGMNPATANLKTAIPYKETAKAAEGEAWDAAAEVGAADVADLKAMCAWYDAENPEVKGSYKLPHHKAGGHAVVWRAVAACMGALLGARGGVDIPESDRRAVYGHISKHYRDFDKEPPDLKLVDLAATVRAASLPEALKEGRVLSSRNLGRLRDALEVLTEILASAEPPPEDDGKTLTERLRIALAIRERELAIL